MAMSRADWRRRYYAPLPSNVQRVHVDHREDHIASVKRQVLDMHSFGQFLYYDVISEASKPFDGTAEWFMRAVKNGWIPIPNKPFPIATVRHALLAFNAHTEALFTEWATRTRQPTFGSYVSFMRRHKVPISLKPITDPLTKEAMNNRS